MGINLLHNSYWAAKEYIINQRGQLEYVGEQFNVVTYCIDRWFLSQASNQAKVKILDNCLEVVFDAGTVFNQRFVAPFLYNKVVTFSFLTLDGQLFVFTEAFPEKSSSNNNKTKQINHNGKVYVIFMQTLPNGISEVFIYNQSGTTATLQLLGAKLELGPVQTLAHREGDTWVLNDLPPDPALEIFKCMRYLRTGVAVGSLIIDNPANAIWTSNPIYLDPPMRVKPTITLSDLVLLLPTSQDNIPLENATWTQWNATNKYFAPFFNIPDGVNISGSGVERVRFSYVADANL